MILLNYRDYAERFLTECYASLERQTYPRERFTVFVVNNAATESGGALVRRLARWARLIENRENLGWAGGNNRAIAVALSGGFDAVVLMNIDTVAEREWLSELVAAAASPGVHILQSVILLHGTDRINSLGNLIHFLGYGYCHGYDHRLGEVKPEPLHFASGAAMLVKREVFERVGLFREEYFLYYEDMEFCWRARLAGFRVGLAERSVCHHKYDFSGKIDQLYLLERNRLLTLFTLERKRTLLLTLPCLIAAQLLSGVYFWFKGYGNVMGRMLAYFSRPGVWKWIIRKRREVGRFRKTADREIVGRFKGQIVFAEVRHPALLYVLNPLLRAYWAVIRPLIFW